MREILFKAKRKDNNEWVEGNISIEYDNSCFISKWVSKLIEPENNFWEPVQEAFEVDPETVCQSIGRNDSKGEKLWEGDIVNCFDDAAKEDNWIFSKEHIGMLEYIDGAFMLRCNGSKRTDGTITNEVWLEMWVNAEHIQKIGNKIDNPELLTNYK